MVKTIENSQLEERIREILGRIGDAAKRSGRSPDSVQLLAVSKTKPLEMIIEALKTGLVTHFGENHVQEGQAKVKAFPKELSATWHLIGHLQRNKVRKAIQYFDIIESIDRVEIADAAERICAENAKNIKVLIEANSSGEASKTGAPMESVPSLAEHIREKCPHLILKGLMTIGPLGADEMGVRKAFDSTRELLEKISLRPSELPMLSMGMSGDFEWAIEQGSTEVRVGTAIFGSR